MWLLRNSVLVVSIIKSLWNVVCPECQLFNGFWAFWVQTTLKSSDLTCWYSFVNNVLLTCCAESFVERSHAGSSMKHTGVDDAGKANQ